MPPQVLPRWVKPSDMNPEWSPVEVRLEPVRCPVSRHVVCYASGHGTIVEVPCKCRRMVRITPTGEITAHDR